MKKPFGKAPIHKRPLRSQLLFYFVLAAVLPAAAISLSSILFGYYTTRANTIKQLDSLIALEEMKIDTWIAGGQDELLMTLNETYLLERTQVMLKLKRRDTYYQYYKQGALFRLNRYLSDTRLLESISVLDLQGNVILSTDPNEENRTYASNPLVQSGARGASTQLVTALDGTNAVTILTVCPVANLDGQVIGVLLGKIKPQSFSELLDLPELDRGSARIILADPQNHIYSAASSALRSTNLPEKLLSRGIRQALQSKQNGFLSYQDEGGQAVYGVYRWIPQLELALLIEQGRSAVLADFFANQAVNLAIIAAGILLAVTLAIFTARRIASPLDSLARAASEIASGNFSLAVNLDQEDEIGVLAKAFNSMAAQIRNLVESLETRVKDRTNALEASNRQLTKRARQTEISAQVSREITSILDMDALLMRVVNLIQESFSYRQVHVFLAEPSENRLIWRAGSNSPHPQSQSLPMNGENLNSQAARENRAIQRDQADPADDAAACELAIPLRMGNQVIGTMDIFHQPPDSFSEDDIKALQSLGDQIAIAINNANLYKKVQSMAVIEERSRMARELHDSISQLLYSQVLYADAGSEYLAAGQSQPAAAYMDQLQESAHQALKEMRLMIYELRPSILEKEGLYGALQHRLEIVERRSGLDAQFEGDPSLCIPAALEKVLYLIAQEALNNVLKHSRAGSVKIAFSGDGQRICFSISDDGAGFDPAAVKSGLGLENIRQYALRNGGTLEIHSQPGQGTRLVVRIPGGNDAY